MAAVLACGDGAALSHRSAAELWGMRARHARRSAAASGESNPLAGGPIEVTVTTGRYVRRRGITLHRRGRLEADDVTSRERIPVTAPVRTILDIAIDSSARELEVAINESDKLDLVDPEALRRALDERSGEQGVAVVRELLDRLTFTLTESELERRFVPLARDAGLPPPLTQQWVNGHRVDFHWPDLGLVVETDGLRYHRTAAQQTADRRRDQAHAAAGLTPLRFSHAQVAFDRDHVRATLRRVARRLGPPERAGGHRQSQI